MGLPTHPGFGARVGAAVAMALAYYALSRFGLAFIEPSSNVSTLWPASGLALATFVVVGRAWWPWLTAGIFAGSLVAQLTDRDDLVLSFALAATNAAEPLLAATVLLAIAGRDAPFALTMRSIGGLLAAVIAANAVTSAAAAAAFTARAGAEFGTAFAQWWTTAGVGMLALAPLALIFGDRSVRAPGRPWEAMGLLTATTAVTLAVFVQGPDSASILRYAYLVIPVAIIPALRLRAWLVAVNLAIIVTIVSVATANGTGPFVRDDLASGEEIIVAQGFIVVVSICVLLVAAVVRQSRAATAEVAAQHAVATASEHRYRLLADHTADLISVHRLDGPATYVSPSAASVLGTPADEAVGVWAGDICHPEDRPAVQRALEAAAAGRPEPPVTYRMPDDDGWRWLETSLRPVEDRERVVELVASTRDVTRRIEAEHALRDSEERHRLVLTHLPDAMVTVCDGDLRIVSLLGGAAERSGLDPDALVGLRLQDVTPADADTLEPRYRAALAGETCTFEYDGRLTDRRYEVTLVPYRDITGAVTGVVSVSRDITTRHELALQLRHLAEHDALTGLINRRRFDEELARHAATVQRYGETGALLMIDLDRFKEVNDTFGHAAGDDHLVRAARCLRGELRGTDIVARHGGDEFAILLPHADAHEAAETASRLVAAMHADYGGLTGDIPLTVSIGVAAFTGPHAADPAEMLAAADAAMYAAKTGGRDRYVVAERLPDGAQAG